VRGICYFIIAGFGHPQFTLDPTAYHTIAGRVTQDGSTNIAQCIYIDGVQQVCGDLLSAGQATGLSGLWNQRNYPIIDVDNPGSPLITTNIDAFVKEIVIFTCDG
jgi:hypothetical protein